MEWNQAYRRLIWDGTKYVLGPEKVVYTLCAPISYTKKETKPCPEFGGWIVSITMTEEPKPDWNLEQFSAN